MLGEKHNCSSQKTDHNLEKGKVSTAISDNFIAFSERIKTTHTTIVLTLHSDPY